MKIDWKSKELLMLEKVKEMEEDFENIVKISTREQLQQCWEDNKEAVKLLYGEAAETVASRSIKAKLLQVVALGKLIDDTK